MCSTPKGSGGGRPPKSSAVNSLMSGMSAAEYSGMVQRANESYERRQVELAERRAARKQNTKLKPDQHQSQNTTRPSMFAWFKNLLHHYSTQHN